LLGRHIGWGTNQPRSGEAHGGIVEERDDSTPVGKLLLSISDRVAAMEEPSFEDVDMSDPEQDAIWKTVQILLNKVIYADSYLQQEAMS